MADWQVASWDEKGVDVYRTAEGKAPQLIHSGLSEGFDDVRGGAGRRVLIIGRSRTVRIRRRYPPMKAGKLRLAVAMEAPTLFPMKDCAFHCRIAAEQATHVLADIWAWEREPADRLLADFPCRFVIPEDLAFLALPPGVTIYPGGSMVHVVACGGGRFGDAASFPAADFAKEDLARFIAGLEEGAAFSEELRVCGGLEVETPDLFARCVRRIPDSPHPPFLETFGRIPLRSFRRESGSSRFSIDGPMLLRFALYGCLAYGLTLFLTLRDYDRNLAVAQGQVRAVEQELSLLGSAPGEGSDAEALKAVDAVLKAGASPLGILDVLADVLPGDSRVTRLVLNNGVVEMSLSARDPFTLLKRLNGAERIAKAGLKGAPVKDPVTGIYNCILSLEAGT